MPKSIASKVTSPEKLETGSQPNIRLANGQWANRRRYFLRYLDFDNPKVAVRRGALTSFYLEIEGTNHSARAAREIESPILVRCLGRFSPDTAPNLEFPLCLNHDRQTPSRRANPETTVLPFAEGRGHYNANIAKTFSRRLAEGVVRRGPRVLCVERKSRKRNIFQAF